MAFAISVGFLGLFAAFAFLGELALQEGSDRLLKERLVIAQMAAAEIDLFLDEAIKELEQAHRYADFDPRGVSIADEIHVLAHTYGRLGTFSSGISFLDADGLVVISEPGNLFTPETDLSNSAHIARSLENQIPTISDAFYNPLTNQPVVAVTIPLFESEELIGLLSGLIDLTGEAIRQPLVRAAELGHTGHAILVDENGHTLASTFNMPFQAPGEHVNFYRSSLRSDFPVVETVRLESFEENSHTTRYHVMAFVTLDTAPWGVAVGGESEETFAGFERLRFGLTLLGVAALLGIWAATLIGTRRLVKPVQQLTMAAQRIADQQMEIPLEVNEGGEIGAMALALERMRILLLDNIEELATWNEVLEHRVAERTQEVRRQQALVQHLLKRAIDAQEEERARLARELHDDIGQMLTAVQLNLDQLSSMAADTDSGLEDNISRVRELTDRTLKDLRKIIADVRPGILGELGLIPALEWMADRSLRPIGLTVTIDNRDQLERLPDETETLFFRIAQEAMVNIARHSKAENIQIELHRQDGFVTMSIVDDGAGFNPAAFEPSQDFTNGLGLASMRERATLAGGYVRVQSAPGEGTRIVVRIPVVTNEAS
jgi:signal transduction histidine kinase